MVPTAGGSHPTVSLDGEWVACHVDGGLSMIPAGGGEAQVLVGSGQIWKVEAPPMPVNRNSWGSLKAGYRTDN